MANCKMQRAERRARLVVYRYNRATWMRFKGIQALDHADVFLLKDMVLERPRLRRFTINLRDVRYLPPGFFGALHEICDNGIKITLANVEPPIREHLWFKRYINRFGRFVVPKDAWNPPR